MHIKEIVVDGFKSYAVRTVIGRWDPMFNAITGLNGSGKSNILDSICFVLGISNLSQVRARNLQELVYKQGQAGVTKATVTITFDNSNPSESPIGYDQYDELVVARTVVIGGKNKYTINGRTAQAKQVETFFHSVGLNVNNPHFLIMQGRITKVLNMKPVEILGMIEEAAGTRMFENKKQSALKTLEKKEVKKAEIDRVLGEEITPTLEKLRGEQSAYLQWSQNNTEMERQERFCVAHEFCEAESTLNEGEGKLGEMEAERTGLESRVSESQSEEERKDDDIKALTEKKDGAVQDAFDALSADHDKVSKELVKINTVAKNLRKEVAKEERAIAKAESDAREGAEQEEALRGGVSAKRAEIDALAAAEAEAQRAHQEAETRYQSVSAGVGAAEDGDNTHAGALAAAEAEATASNAAVDQGRTKMKIMGKEIAKLERDLKKTGKDQAKDGEKLNDLQGLVAGMEGELGALDYSEEDEAAVLDEKRRQAAEVDTLRDQKDRLEAALSAKLKFEFKSPGRDFDRSRVEGMLAKLVEVRRPEMATALEVVAGGKLFQVVVDTDATASALLQRGQLKQRVTIIPLNKISRKTIPEGKAAIAARVAAEHNASAAPALSFVGFREEVRAAMEYAFGSSLVCDTLEAARAVTFHKGVKTKCVTLDGDVCDPGGTLTGGSSNNLGAILSRLQQLREVSAALADAEARLADLDARVEAMAASVQQHDRLSKKLELKRHELALLQERMAKSQHGMLMAKLEEAQAGVAEAEHAVAEAEATAEAALARAAELRAEESAFQERREAMLREIESDVAEKKSKAAEATAARKASSQALQEDEEELIQLGKERVAEDERIEAARGDLERQRTKADEQEAAVEAKRGEYDEVKAEFDAKKEELAACDKQIRVLIKQRDQASKAAAAAELEAKKLGHKIERFHKDQVAARKNVERMTAKHPWIDSEKQFFGSPGTDYDFEATDPKKAAQRLSQLKRQQDKLGKRVNKKVMGMIEKAEAEYQNLMAKKRIIENDRRKIEGVIEGLEIKKVQTLQQTWVKVNRDFGSIFTMLLPGTQAKLQPPEDASGIMDGLEVKVAFGDVWKESLTELSGGQRSLLALSLILSLLLFKPAPMYILDEVDAALDLSHTQNIGQMLRTHFSQSQFIVVSLKEGMFNNANVVFRTKFVDGVSTVTRTTPAGGTALEHESEEADEENVGGRRKRGKAGKAGSRSAQRGSRAAVSAR